MAKPHAAQRTVVEPPTEDSGKVAEPIVEPGARPPQGIVIRTMATGNPNRDFHPKHRTKRMIDPACLIVDGKDPVLMLPREGIAGQVAKRVGAQHAALLLTCDFVTGNPPMERLASDAEVAAYEARHAQLVANAEKAAEKAAAKASRK